jgi:AraC-like DNA-binding protein
MIIPVRNGLTGLMNDKYYETSTNKIALVGMSDRSSIVDAKTQSAVASIGVEITAMGAYRFFHLRLKDISNALYSLPDILGKTAAVIEERLVETTCINSKIYLLQQFLLSHFTKKEEDPLFEYCISRIQNSTSYNLMKQLERETGYSSRWLNLKFEERLGISPKNYSSIVRFQKYYRELLLNPTEFFKQKSFYDYYYDESHFIKDFRRFTDISPNRLVRAKNDFGKTFYKD